MRNARRKTHESNEGLDPLPERLRTRAGLWYLRLLAEGGRSSRLEGSSDLRRTVESQAEELVAEDATDRFGPRASRFRHLVGVVTRWRSELEAAPPALDRFVAKNLRRLGERLALDPVECELLALASQIDVDSQMQQLFRAFSPVTISRVHSIAGTALGVPAKAVAHALRPDGPLGRCRLLRIAISGRFSDTTLKLLDGMADSILNPAPSDDKFFGNFVRRAPAAELDLAAFEHVGKDLGFLRDLLGAALAGSARGTNLLLHGAPGTGKTQLARALAAACEATAWDVVVDNVDGEALSGADRLARGALCQELLARTRRSVLVFDELEDAFPAGIDFGSFLLDRPSRRGAGKGWINRMLEENKVPTIWLGNDIRQLDPAYLRRFQFIVELRTPPARVRRRMLDRAVDGLPLGESFLARIADDDRMRPADVTRATGITRLLQPPDRAGTEQLFERVLTAGFEAEGKRRSRPRAPLEFGDFDLRFVNASLDPAQVVEGLRRAGRGTLLLSGPPGTGKTAFVSHLASALGRPLHAKRASDLLSKWVGGTEALIAGAFRDATDAGALLFLDEADSFLQDRRRSQASWEVTQVNELLQQIESFDGVLACATNLLENLDTAVLRRFAFKVTLSPLALDQRIEVLRRALGSLGASPLVDDDLDALRPVLARLEGLTAGDVAAVVRRFRATAEPATAAVLVEAFAAECRFKPPAARKVGFGGE